MTVEDAKKIFAGNVIAVSPEVLQEAAQIILSELGKAEKKIVELEEENILFRLEDLPGEIWKDIENYEGHYQISNKGRLKSFKKNPAKILHPNHTQFGYFQVTIYKNSEKNFFMVHVLVARAFISNPENKPFVNHKDGNKKNNCVENLEWVTASENTRHSLNLGLQKIKKGVETHQAKLNEEQVKFIRNFCKKKDPNFGLTALAKKFDVSISTIGKAFSRKTYDNVK